MRNILKNKLLNLAIILFYTAILVGCSGDNGSSASFNSNTAIPVTMCNDATTPWTALSSGDTVSATTASQLKFDHDSNGNKQVCVVTGSATVLKG